MDPQDIGRSQDTEKEGKRKRRKGQMLQQWPTTETKTLDLAPIAKIVEVDGLGDVADS